MVVTRQDELVRRLRARFAEAPSLREVSMFGGRSFMVDDRMLLSARKDGGLLVRIDAARHDELTARPGASPAEMGTGRTMGPGWILVESDAVADEAAFHFWIDVAEQYHRSSADPLT